MNILLGPREIHFARKGALDISIADNAIALAQAKHIYEWLHEDCKEHIRTTRYLGIRMEGDFLERRYCPECMAEYRKELGL